MKICINAGNFIQFDLYELAKDNLEVLTHYNKSDYVKYEVVIANNKKRISKIITNKQELISFSSVQTEDLEGDFNVYILFYINDDDKISFKVKTINFKNLFYSSSNKIEEMIEVIEEILKGRIKQEYISYTINNRSITKYSPKELIEILAYYRKELYNKKLSELSPAQKQRAQLRLINEVEHDF